MQGRLYTSGETSNYLPAGTNTGFFTTELYILRSVR